MTTITKSILLTEKPHKFITVHRYRKTHSKIWNIYIFFNLKKGNIRITLNRYIPGPRTKGSVLRVLAVFLGAMFISQDPQNQLTISHESSPRGSNIFFQSSPAPK